MAQSFEIRTARNDDAALLSVLSIEVWLNTYAKLGISKQYADHLLSNLRPEAFTKLLDDKRYRISVCYEGEYLLGYVTVCLDPATSPTGSGDMEIETLYVRAHHWNRGLGTALFSEALTNGLRWGKAKAFLTVNHENSRAINFYEYRGMKREGDWIYRFSGIEVLNFIYTIDTGIQARAG